MPHQEVLSGRIISSQIGYFGKNEILYGYIAVETEDKKHVTLKVDAYTKYETITIGDHVRVDVHSLANTDILVAREIVAATPLVRVRTVKAETAN
ncbi:MAG: hypothetical protein ACXADC_10290 [Candidatus Thorarchaeota archaeon]|jgi:hypothetical protein